MKTLQTFEADYRETYELVRYAVGLFPGLHAYADDLIQDVYLGYWQHWDAIPPEKRRAWLLVTARHKAIDKLRRMQALRTDLHLNLLPAEVWPRELAPKIPVW